MKRILFYFLSSIAFASRIFHNGLYMKMIILAHKAVGVKFSGKPEYIHQDAYLDPSGGLTLNSGCVISTKVIILTHDWSFLKRIDQKELSHNRYDEIAYKPVSIGCNSFIGAGAIVLPGTDIGFNCIIGAGAVVKGIIPDGSIMVGNPAKNIAKH